MDIQKVKGTHDVILAEAEGYEKIEDTMKAIAESFAFHQFRVPIIENSALFQRSVGESSDIVRKEMYTFLDKGERSITLRPEFTAGIIRSFVNAKLYATKDLPVKAYYCGPVFRYERPQLGRYRQFNQFGIETIGTDNLYHDVEAIVLGYEILQCLGLKDVKVKINTLGDEQSRQNYKAALQEFFKAHIDNMCPDCKQRFELNPLRILDCKVPEDQEIVKHAPKMSEYLTKEAKDRFDQVLKILENMNLPYEVDDTLVRGLDYYSQVVFEFHYTSSKGQNYGAIGAGGHYGNLVHEIGGPQMEGVGFSFGIERVYSVMHDDGLIGDETSGIDMYVMPMGKEYIEPCFSLTTFIRNNGYTVECDVNGGKMGTMFKKANRANARFAIIVGEEEYNNNLVTIKDLENEEQEQVALNEIIAYFDEAFDLHEEHEHCNCGCEDHDHEETCSCGCHHDDHCCDDDCCCHEEEDHESDEECCCCGHHHHNG